MPLPMNEDTDVEESIVPSIQSSRQEDSSERMEM